VKYSGLPGVVAGLGSGLVIPTCARALRLQPARNGNVQFGPRAGASYLFFGPPHNEFATRPL